MPKLVQILDPILVVNLMFGWKKYRMVLQNRLLIVTIPTQKQVIWVRIASEITLRRVRLESDNMFVNHYKSIGYKNKKCHGVKQGSKPIKANEPCSVPMERVELLCNV